MLRIVAQTSPAAAKGYYAAADYYAEEAVGRWGGKGAERLGLTGPVGREAFDALCDNRHPATGGPLTARTKGERRVGYDFTFGAPKSLSVLFALTGDTRLDEAFRLAVADTMADLEAEARTRVRVGGGRGDRLTGELVWGTFVHTTARPVGGVPDPHLHAHCFAFNATFDPVEGRWKAAELGPVKADAPRFEARYHARLARAVADLGYPVERTAAGWEVAAVPKRVRTAFSRRTVEIERLAAEKGITDPKALDALGAKTRRAKDHRLSPAELTAAWDGRLSAPDREAIAAARLGAVRSAAGADPDRAADRALDFATRHLFATESVVRERDLETRALRQGYGEATPAAVRRAIDRAGLVRAVVAGEALCTTREALAEEQAAVRFARSGRGACAPLGGTGPHAVRRDFLSADQRRAVRHLLGSADRVMVVVGKAGTGKTTLLQEFREAVEARGRRVVAVAPTAAAGRGVLRAEGFAAADTVQALLADPARQAALAGQVLLVDEAGLLGVPTLARLFRVAAERDARVVLVGDPGQHRAVERGSPLKILADQAGVRAVEVAEVQRQRGAYKGAVEALAAGRAGVGFDRLDALGWVAELPDPDERDRAVARDYAAAVAAGRSALVLAPTVAEGERVTTAVRQALRADGRVAAAERAVARLVPYHWTEAERGDPAQYQAGDVVQFVQHAPGFRRGERLTVTAVAASGVTATDATGVARAVPLGRAGRFQVFRPAALSVASGDRLRVTLGGRDAGGRRLDNGTLVTVAGFTPAGDILLDTGRRIGHTFGHLAHGYVTTSVSGQGRTVDVAFVSQSAASGRAASAEQFYVSASRARHAVRVYVDDKAAVRAMIGRVTRPLSAHDLTRRADRGAFLRRVRRVWQWAAERLGPDLLGGAIARRNAGDPAMRHKELERER